MGVNAKTILLAARWLSILFTPFYLPMLGVASLFAFTYLGILPFSYKLIVALIVYVFTIPLPSLLIRIYRNYHGWTLWQLGYRERRAMPYVISIMCYIVCLYVMSVMRIPHFVGGILMAALAVQVACAMVNIWWKISTHTAAIGGVAGALTAFASLLNFNPVWWLCAVVLLGGLVGSARMILRQHTLWQVTAGFLLGTAAARYAILAM